NSTLPTISSEHAIPSLRNGYAPAACVISSAAAVSPSTAAGPITAISSRGQIRPSNQQDSLLAITHLPGLGGSRCLLRTGHDVREDRRPSPPGSFAIRGRDPPGCDLHDRSQRLANAAAQNSA